MDITNDGLIPGVNSYDRRIQFWHTLVQKYKFIFHGNDNNDDDDEMTNGKDEIQ